MTVPDYQSLMASTLHALAGGQKRSMSELRTVIADQLALTPEDLRATITSGGTLFASRLHKATEYHPGRPADECPGRRCTRHSLRIRRPGVRVPPSAPPSAPRSAGPRLLTNGLLANGLANTGLLTGRN
jgi:hypothetical protein